MAPRISVLLPTHNRADVLGYAIQSVLWQTEPDFELLIVGDGCTDNTAEIVASFPDPRIRWFDFPKAPHFGYANRNRALKEAKGDFIGFMAHDDLIFPDHLSLLAAALDKEEAELGYSRPLWVSTDGIVLPFGINLSNEDELEYFLKVSNSIPASCFMHRRSCFTSYGYWPEDVAHSGDWHLWKRIVEGGGKRIAYSRVPTVLHFKAVWRKGRAGFSRAEVGLLAVAALGWWPAALKLDIPPGAKEQQVFFDAITAGGMAWLTQFRQAADDAIDRLAWTVITDFMSELNRRQNKIADLTSRVETQANELASSKANTIQLKSEATRAEKNSRKLERSWKLQAKNLAQSEARVKRLAAKAALADKHRSNTRELKAVYASRSWRLTAPLRALNAFWARWLSLGPFQSLRRKASRTQKADS
jgi:glycosyltransferase involved in cell wall biosynthesis